MRKFTDKQIAKARTRASAFAASADPTRNTNEAERATAQAKLVKLCTEYGFKLSDFTNTGLVASPSTGEAPKPKAEPKPSDIEAERARAEANRAFVAKHYTSGASHASHAARAPKLAEALARVASPVQLAKSASTRDESGLLLASKHANGHGEFCPVAGTFDLGVLSRLASLKLIAVCPNKPMLKLTKAGRDLAANVARKAA